MFEIDGSLHSGSGTILRYAMCLATLLRKPLHMTHIRAARNKPGLRPQHLQAVQACCALSGGQVKGDVVGSQEIFYFPGDRLEGGDYQWNIGTAGSTTMLAMTVLPLALFSNVPSRFSIVGGLFQDFAPSALYMQRVLVPLLSHMGAEIHVEILRPGYVPKGQGHLHVKVEPVRKTMEALTLTKQGIVERIHGIALSSHLEASNVSERMATQCKKLLKKEGYLLDIEVIDDKKAVQRGAALLLWAETDTGVILGADQAGKPGRKSEEIARFVVRSLLKDLRSGATADRHMADQLILFAALACGVTEYRIPEITDHVSSNLWLVEKFLGVRTELNNNHLKIGGIGLKPSGV